MKATVIDDELDLISDAMSDEEFLEHYGVKRRSGRYPWGSGEEPYSWM